MSQQSVSERSPLDGMRVVVLVADGIERELIALLAERHRAEQ